MKYCPHEAFRYPDDVSTCIVCGKSLVDVSSLDDLPDEMRTSVATACCPKPGCKTLVVPSTSNFCAACGNRLEPISYEAWLHKFVEPALVDQTAADLRDTSVLFQPIVEMGLSRSQARKILDSFVERRKVELRKEARLKRKLIENTEPGEDVQPEETESDFELDHVPASIVESNVPRSTFLTRHIMLVVAIPLLLVIPFLVWTSSRKESSIADTPAPTPTPSPSEMVLIKGATFMMGNDDGDEYERPQHAVIVSSFYIDIHEVTNEEYAQFVKATGYPAPRFWRNNTPAPEIAKLPVTGVDWYAANAYARWQKKRLPTEEEWELAARTHNSWRYPWGNDWRENAANAAASSANGLVAVGSYPAGNNPEGVTDLIGNAWEWTASDLKAYRGGDLSSRPTVRLKVIRGGSWQENANQATGSYRGYLRAVGAADYSATGFRCARDVSPNQSNNR